MSNYFQLYYDYIKEYEPPPNYHAWSAVGAISALLGKKCVIPYGTFNVYPNLYIILVGKPGMKKSSAMGIAKKLVKTVETVGFASDCGSREGLMDEMMKNKVEGKGFMPYWQSAIFVDEIGDLLGGEHLDGGMVRFLTTIWDQSIYKEATRKSGQVIIHNPYLTLLGCCPTEWMSTKLRQDVITDGLSRRTIFVYENKLNRLNSRPPTPNVEQRTRLEQAAKRMHEMTGDFALTKDAWEFFDQFYYDTQAKLLEHPENLQSYFSSKHMLVLKICICISAGVSSNRVITAPMVKAACGFLERSEQNLSVVFGGVGRNELKSYSEKVLDKIKASGKAGLSKAELTKMFYADLTIDEINEVTTMLMDTNQCELLPTLSLQGAPTFRAQQTEQPLPEVDLMQLVRHLEPYSGPPLAETAVVSSLHHLAPETLRLLSDREERRHQTSSGILLRGKPPQDVDELPSPSNLRIW